MTPQEPERAATAAPELTETRISSLALPRITRLPIKFESDYPRVITLPFLPGGGARIFTLLERIDGLSEEDVERELEAVRESYGSRHKDLMAVFQEHFRQGVLLTGFSREWPQARCLLAGAYLTMEYAFESAALFNPSIVPHPDQSGLEDGSARFIMSLRATGEGHVSSIVFRTGVIRPDERVQVAPPAPRLHRARISPDRHYLKGLFQRKLLEMDVRSPLVPQILSHLPEKFTLAELEAGVERARPMYRTGPGGTQTIERILWLARSNYHIVMPQDADISEVVIFPLSEEESHGIEDLRLVRFADDDGSITYFGTYTAYNGHATLPMLIATKDFHRIDVHSLNGSCAMNKGMALFPRRIDGHYAMCSRIDGENLFIMYSDYVHFWESAARIEVARAPWELTQLGNCGSPVETQEGWLLLTHGVGPMREYCIGALLLDLEDPLRVIGHLREPLIAPAGREREGYVPNVVYTCGAMIHRDKLYLPFSVADKSTGLATIDLGELIQRLLESPP